MSVVTLNPDKPGFLDPDGHPLWIHGVNYEGFYDRAWAMWRPELYDPGLISMIFKKRESAVLIQSVSLCKKKMLTK